MLRTSYNLEVTSFWEEACGLGGVGALKCHVIKVDFLISHHLKTVPNGAQFIHIFPQIIICYSIWFIIHHTFKKKNLIYGSTFKIDFISPCYICSEKPFYQHQKLLHL